MYVNISISLSLYIYIYIYIGEGGGFFEHGCSKSGRGKTTHQRR